MNAATALARLRALATPVITTADAAAALELRPDAASQTLRRLQAAGLVLCLRKGLWSLDELPSQAALAEYVTAPYPGYVSLQSALYLRGMIEQVPRVLYVVSLGRATRVDTTAGTFSIHHLPAELFGGYDHDVDTGTKLATGEKALFDLAYLSGTRSRKFRTLPEFELSSAFRPARVRHWVRQIPSQRMRTLALRRVEELLATARVTANTGRPGVGISGHEK